MKVLVAGRTNEARGTAADNPWKACDELAQAMDGGGIGDIVAKHEELILHYYKDVQTQAAESFQTARWSAWAGFAVLMIALGYALVSDALGRAGNGSARHSPFTVAQIGIVSAALIEFISAIAFWLYSRGARQFGAFHICLERTHRYLLAYKIGDQLKNNRDDALKDLMCIMANAPMITRGDVDGAAEGGTRAKAVPHKGASTEVKIS
jgi:TRADD-N domain-containing protein